MRESVSGVDEPEPRRYEPGTRVEVRNTFDQTWSKGFVVVEATEQGYRVAPALRPAGTPGHHRHRSRAPRTQELDVVDLNGSGAGSAAQGRDVVVDLDGREGVGAQGASR